MTKQFAAACAIIALSSLTPAAQPSPQPTSKSSADSALTVTVTGCLQSAAGSQAASAGGAQYVLTNVQHGASGKSRDSQPSSTTQAASEHGRAGGVSYALSPASAGVNLSQHVNHKVQITGTKIAGRGAAKGESPSRDTQTPAMTMPGISVTSLKMVSDSCS